MYLTHFGRVRDLGRLASDLEQAIARFVEWGEQHADDAQRSARIEEAMMVWLIDGARAHGVTLPDATLRKLFAGDVTLNTQGIEFWLDHGR